MVIERAIEKLKNSGGLPDADARLRAKARDAVSRPGKGPALPPPPQWRWCAGPH